jgi:hypothetical protein
MRLNGSQIQSIKQLSKKGKSIRQISNTLNINMTTVYYYTRKENGLKIRQPKFDTLNDSEIGEIIGAFAGDGSYCYSSTGRSGNHNVRFHFGKGDPYIERLNVILSKAQLNTFIYPTKRNGMDLKMNSLSLISMIKGYLSWDGKKTYSVRLKSREQSEFFLTGFFIGLMRTDGFIGKRLSLSSTSKHLAEDFSYALKRLNIEFKTSTYKDRRENRMLRYNVNVEKTSKERCLSILRMNGAMV